MADLIKQKMHVQSIAPFGLSKIRHARLCRRPRCTFSRRVDKRGEMPFDERAAGVPICAFTDSPHSGEQQRLRSIRQAAQLAFLRATDLRNKTQGAGARSTRPGAE